MGLAREGSPVPRELWWRRRIRPCLPHCLRRLDGTKVYPADVIGEVHADGEIWSRALWDIRRALGDTRASTAIVEAQFGFAPDTTFRAAALATVATAQRLYGAAAARRRSRPSPTAASSDGRALASGVTSATRATTPGTDESSGRSRSYGS